MNRIAPLLGLVAACIPDAPSEPSFQQHVLPIFAANCVRCHGYPAIGGAPPTLRLDSYDDRVVAERDDAGQLREDLASGAAAFHGLVVLRVDSTGATRMPPRFGLDDYQRETLARWSESGGGGTPPRGAPRPDNHVPTIEVRATSQTGAILEIAVVVGDADGDLVAGELRARVGTDARFVGPVRSGTSTIRWDATAIAPGSYPLTAHLDDGAQVHIVELGMLDLGGS